MKFLELKDKLSQNIFTFLDVVKFFSQENKHAIRVQLSRFTKKGLIQAIKKGIYCFESQEVDELVLAQILYKPSYISLETALNYWGVIPDVPQVVTSVTPTTTKTIKIDLGDFYYAKIKKELFFGFMKMGDVDQYQIKIALLEKALLDYIYLRKITSLASLRLDLKDFNKKTYDKFSRNYPDWVKNVKL